MTGFEACVSCNVRSNVNCHSNIISGTNRKTTAHPLGGAKVRGARILGVRIKSIFKVNVDFLAT